MAFPNKINPLILLEKHKDSDKITFHKKNLKMVFSQVNNLPICAISIAAHASQGSSLLLGYFLQYLLLLEEENDIEEPNLLPPFTWEEGQQPSEDQAGTWIVNKPFIINDSAVILLYSQCSEDEFYSEETAMNTLAGLDLHISCLTIIISSDKLSLEFLSKVATFINFRKNQENDLTQELAFFVPNWTMISRYPLGGEGGQKLFQQMLNACPDDVQEDISNHFNTIYTHLAPKSGEPKVFKGNLEELDPSFVESMDSFVGSLLNSEIFQNQTLTKKIFKNTLYSFLKITEIISDVGTDSEDEPETEIRQSPMMFPASKASSEELDSEGKEQTEVALDVAAKDYLQAMEKALSQGVSSTVFLELHNQSREKCLEQLEDDLGAEWENNCEERLDERLRPLLEMLQDKYHIESSLNQEEKQESNPIAEVELATAEALNYYEQEMEKLSENGPCMERFLDEKNEQLVEDICKKYMDYLNSLNISGTLEEYEETLRNELCTIYVPLRTENAQKFEVSITQIKRMSIICLKEYESIMNQELSNVQSTEELQNLHEAAYNRAMMILQKAHLEQHDPDFVQNNMIELKNAIESAFEEILELYELKMAKEAGDTASELRKCRQFYEDEMDKHFRSNEFIKLEELKKLHQRVSETVLKTIPNLTEEQKLDLERRMEEIYMKYVELNAMNSQEQPAIGIDLGTTYCCTAIYTKGKVHVVRNGIGKNTTPSYVAFKNGKEIVGDAAKRQAFSNPEKTIFDAKRIIGRKFRDPKLQEDMKLWPFSVVDEQGIPKIAVGDRNLHPEEISAKLLKQLKLDAEVYLGEQVTKAVITVPAYFTDGQRQATIDAGTMAGLNVLSIIAEPTAAALAYKLQHSFENRERNVIIFDLGGGTFDVVVMRTSKGKIDVLGVDGDTHLGGEDFDKSLMEYCTVQFKKQHNVDLFDGKDSENRQKKDEARRKLKRLQGECEKRKVELAAARIAEVNVDNMHGDIDLNVMVTRETFEELNATLFQKTVKIVEKALAAAKLDKSRIDDVVLVGGSTRIPKIQELLKNYFGGKTLDCSINPDEAVAYGAAMHAAMLNGLVAKDSAEYEEIQDVAPMSIGLQMYGGGFSVIIPKSTKTPVKAKERYRTAHDNQTSVQITIYQGEDKIAAKNEKLGDFYLNGIPPQLAGKENVDVEMMINSQGILNVTAVSLSTGIREVSVIENKMRMGKEAIDSYLQIERLSHGN